MPTQTFDYKRYLASREWAVRREAVRERCGGWCERCLLLPMASTHHLTYEHVGDEPLEDLQGVCGSCHAFLSAKSDFDPAQWAARCLDLMRNEATPCDEYVRLLKDLAVVVGNARAVVVADTVCQAVSDARGAAPTSLADPRVQLGVACLALAPPRNDPSPKRRGTSRRRRA